MYVLDHIVLAAPDLDEAKRVFQERTGVMPMDGGPHEGLGTRNALVAVGEGAYLELIAPDPEQSLAGTRGERFAQLADTRLLHWAVQAADLEGVATRAREVGLRPGEVVPMTRIRPDGERLAWKLLGVGGHDVGGCAPFFIDWLETPHPSASAPDAGKLSRFQIDLPAGSAVKDLLDSGPSEASFVEGAPRLTLTIDSPRGPVTWTAENPAGFGL